MLNNKFTDYKTVNTLIAVFSGLIGVGLLIAPSTLSNIFNVKYGANYN